MNSRLNPNQLVDPDGIDRDEEKPRRAAAAARLKLKKKTSAQAAVDVLIDKKKSEHAVQDEIIQHNGAGLVADEQAFRPTFTSSRHEREWILDFLGPFYAEQMISDVIARVRGGKEANVYCCTAFPGLGVELVAAKVYRPRMFRSLRNDSLYREGRAVLDPNGKAVIDHGELHAMYKGTSYGKELAHISWLGHEYRALQILHAAGADVPRPFATRNNTILMEYLGEAYRPAPTLNEVRLDTKVEARRLYERLLANVEIMLANQYIHGDLSAYNVLYWEGQFRIIDFPQVVAPQDNRASFAILHRDLARLCKYFERYNIHSRPEMLARRLWQKHGYGNLWLDDLTDWEDQGEP